MKTSAVMIALYLGAIVAANFAVATWGQPALVLTAWVLIPFDLVTRDVLHERWGEDRWLWPRMAGLILGGAALTAALSWEARQIALASCLAFGLAGAVNAGVYHLLRERSRFVRMNASNALAAITDSLVFPFVAFGVAATSGALCASQAGSKFAGGLFWSWLFVKVLWGRKKEVASE